MRIARVLVVDDEPAVAQLVGRLLAKRGYEVVVVTDVHEAVRLATNGARIDLIVSDIMMPEMKGPELIRTVQQHSPAVLGLLMSGYTDEEHPEDIALIHKPFTPDQLAEAVSRALGRGEGQEATSAY